MNWKIGLIAGVAAVLLVVVGCVYGPRRVAYNTLAGTEITVDEAMQAWGDYVKNFHPTPQQEQQVKDIYEKYQVAEAEAVSAAQLVSDLTSAGGTNAAPGLADAQSKATAAAANVAQVFSDLLGLLREFGVKI
jgi:hypothetical protein